MEVYSLEKIITIAILCVWFVFPFGMFVSVMYQDKHQKYPKITQVYKQNQPEHYKKFVINEIDDDQYDDNGAIPIPPAHQIPKSPDVHSNWKT